MNIKEILAQFKCYKNGYLPKKAIQAAIEQQKEITPYLLDILEDAVTNTQKYLDSQTLMWHIYATYLLAQFREPKAYPLIVQMLSKPDDIPFDFFGDGVTEDMGRILAAVCGGDLSLIKKLIEDELINEYVRSASLTALLTLYVENELDRVEIIEYFKSLYQSKLKRVKGDFVWGSLVGNSRKIYAVDLMPDIEQAFNDKLVERGYIRLEDIQIHFNKGEAYVLQQLQESYHHHFITDTGELMLTWSSFNKPVEPPVKQSSQVKIGRNSPCPCGSGKKYKKCCLN